MGVRNVVEEVKLQFGLLRLVVPDKVTSSKLSISSRHMTAIHLVDSSSIQARVVSFRFISESLVKTWSRVQEIEVKLVYLLQRLPKDYCVWRTAWMTRLIFL